MKNIYLIMLFLAFAGMGYGQGLEDFTNSNATTSYSDNDFVGQNGITWYYIQSRDANGDANGSGITLPALMLRRSSSNSKVYSETISGGIGNFSVKLYKGFTGSGNRQVELFINDVSYGTSVAFDDFNEHVFTVNNINISGNIVIRIDDITSKQVIVDDITWTSFASSGPDNPANLLATTVSTSEIDLSWSRNSNLDEVMLVWSPDNSFGTPADGTSYAVGDTIPGGDSVIYVGTDTTYSHTSLTHGTHYYYKAFSVDGSTNYSNGITDDATTYKDEPSNHVTAFAAGTPTSSTIPLTWNDNDGAVVADSFLVMINTTGTFTPPVDGTPQTDDTDVSDGSGQINVAHGDQAYTWSNLAQSTHYYFTIYPFTNSGSAVDFKTNGTVPTADTSTTAAATTTLPYSQTFDADLGDCQTYSVSGTTKEWDWNSTDQAAQMNGYNSGDLEEDWMFIPGINLDNYSNEGMTFDTWYKYGADDADNYLKLMYSTDYSGSGDPSGATWTELSFTHPSSDQTWASSGDVDLSGISGTSVHIAFKYHYNSGSYRRWEVDNISIQESGTDPEPTNYPTAFAATVNSPIAITNTWTDATGAQLPSGYVLYINLTGTFTPPVDGTPVSDDTDLSDGEGVVNVNYGVETYQWTGLDMTTQYYFTIYPYSNSGNTIDFKTDGTAPTANATTTTANTGLIISEVADPKDNANGRFVELYNVSSDTIFFTTEDWYLTKQVNTGTYYDIHLSDTIPPGETYVVGNSDANFSGAYGFNPNQSNGNISGNGDDGYYLYYGGDHSAGTLIDAYGVFDEDGTGKAWEYLDGKAVRKRSIGSPNSTWTASEWVISRPANVVNMTPGQHFNYVTWQGTTDSDWDTKANWDNGFIPDVSMNVTVDAASNDPVISTSTVARCWDLTVNATASLTIQSDASGQGALIVSGSATGDATVKCFATAGKWHGIATPVSGQTANNLYFSGSPDVWAKSYNEADNTYTYITDLGTNLGDMKGWMIWIDSTNVTDVTFTFDGALRSGTVSPSESIARSQVGSDYGYNFVGNPFTSTIDWDDSTGWTKTNLNDAIYVYNDTSFASYVGGTGVNGGSNNIAMNQGFFVQVADDGSTSGTLTATSDVQVANSSTFRKTTRANGNTSLLRLQLSANGVTDETVIKLQENATSCFDGSLDAHKIFSFNQNNPQLFSTANGNMSINTLPPETGFVDMDVKGHNGDLMTIQITERTNLNEVWLVDELTGEEADLVKGPYTFTYNNTFTNRFTLHFSIVGVNEQEAAAHHFKIYASGSNAYVVIPAGEQANIEIYNLLGQKVDGAMKRSGFTRFQLKGNQYYVVKVYGVAGMETQKILIGQ